MQGSRKTALIRTDSLEFHFVCEESKSSRNLNLLKRMFYDSLP